MPSVSGTQTEHGAEHMQQQVRTCNRKDEGHHQTGHLLPLRTRFCCQVRFAEALAAELKAFLWPHGRQEDSGKAWANIEVATEKKIKHFMQTQGCTSVKIKNHSYFDSAKTRVKKRVFKCSCAGIYKPRDVDGIAVAGGARQTTTKKTNCGVYINVNVEGSTCK